MMSLMDEVPRGELQSRTHWRRSPLGREGLAILALRKLNRQPCFFSSLCRHTPFGSAGKLHTEFVTLYRAPPRLLRRVTRSRYAALSR